MKKILILSTSNPYRTAGTAAYDLFKGFQNKGCFVRLLVENYDEYEEDVLCIQSKIEYKIRRLILKLRIRYAKNTEKILGKSKKYETFQKYTFESIFLRRKEYSTKKILKKAGFKPDVIIVIFSQYFISIRNLKELKEKTQASIYWQFADMYPFTGGCHYAWDCEGYKKLCENCPAFKNRKFSDVPNTILSNNIQLMEDLDITAVIGSDWLIKRAEKSTLFNNKQIEKIYLSLDTDLFKPFDENQRRKLRKSYDIEIDKYVILIMASNLGHERKGVNIILEALSFLSGNFIDKNRLHLLLVGRGFDSIKDLIPSNIPYSKVNFVNRNELPGIYNVSNLFVSASLQEVGPYTLTESLLCSVPVVALNHGYANEFILNKKTGMLVKDDSAKSLSLAITDIMKLNQEDLNIMKENCRNFTQNIVSKEKQINSYLNLINNYKYEE